MVRLKYCIRLKHCEFCCYVSIPNGSIKIFLRAYLRAGQKVSIPNGSIKIYNNNAIYIRGFRVSIPNGSIKIGEITSGGSMKNVSIPNGSIKIGSSTSYYCDYNVSIPNGSIKIIDAINQILDLD